MLNIGIYNYPYLNNTHNRMSKLHAVPKLKQLTCDTVSFTGVNNNGVNSRIDLPEGNNKGTLYRKVLDIDDEIVKEPFEADIECLNENPGNYTYYLYDDMKRVGIVKLREVKDTNKYIFGERTVYNDFEKEDIKGERLIVEMIINYKENEIGGVGALADRIEVEHCLRRGLKPNIVSYSFPESAIKHYIRGKRFVQFENQANINNMLENLLFESEPGDELDTSIMLRDYDLIAYMPKKMVNDITEEIKKHPLLNFNN